MNKLYYVRQLKYFITNLAVASMQLLRFIFGATAIDL